MAGGISLAKRAARGSAIDRLMASEDPYLSAFKYFKLENNQKPVKNWCQIVSALSEVFEEL